MKETLKVKRITKTARLPVRKSKLAAGYDLFADQPFNVLPGTSEVIPTGLMMKTPRGTYGRIAPRSGLAVKNNIGVNGGVVDSDYRGDVGVILMNYGDEIFTVKTGDRIAQLILEKIAQPEVEEVEELDETERGEGGFGSTGKSD